MSRSRRSRSASVAATARSATHQFPPRGGRVFEISPRRMRLPCQATGGDSGVGDGDGDGNCSCGGDGVGCPAGVLETGSARYHLAARIGEGGFGTTYLAWIADSKRRAMPRGRPVVVKAMKLPSFAEGRVGALEMHHGRSMESMDVVRSIAHVRSCRHPFIAKLLDSRYALSTDETPFEVYEYYPAGDALSLIDHVGAADEPHKEAVNLQAYVLYLGVQVSEALSYLHESGFIHFDLKLDNVFIDELGDAKLGDFGLAKPCRLGRSLDNPYCYWHGRPAPEFTATRWVPPEQLAEAETLVSHSVDWYSLGALLYHLVYRRLPFEEHRTRALAEEGGEERRKRRFLQLWRAGPRPRVDERPKVSQRFKNLIYNLLAFEQSQRLGGGGCDEVFRQLHQLCSGLKLAWFDSVEPTDVDKIRSLVRRKEISRPYRVKLLELGLP